MVGRYPPHNIMSRVYPNPAQDRTADISTVTKTLVPQLMMLSELLSPSYIPQPRGRCSQTIRCEKCGTSHGEVYECPALNRKCYICRRYGHYANLCLSKKNGEIYDIEGESDAESEDSFISTVSVSSTQRLTELEKDLADSSRQITSLVRENAELKQLTDSLRMTNQQLSDDREVLITAKTELDSVTQENVKLKNQCADLKSQFQEAECVSSKLKCENQNLKKECADLKLRFQESESVSSKLNSENLNLKKECADLKSQIRNHEKRSSQLQSVQSEVSSKIKSENVKLKKENADLKSQIKNVEKQSYQVQKENSEFRTRRAELETLNTGYVQQVSQLTVSVAEAEQKAKQLDKDIGELYRASVRFSNDITERYDDLVDQLLDEFNKVASKYMYATLGHPQYTILNPCQRCGTHLKGGDCPADGWNCYRCGKMNHFASVCRSAPYINMPELHLCKELYKNINMKHADQNYR